MSRYSTQFADLGDVPFTYAPERRLVPKVTGFSPARLLRILLCVVGGAAAGTFIMVNYGHLILALLR